MSTTELTPSASTTTSGPTDRLVSALPDRIDPSIIKELSQLRPWISLAAIAREYIFVIGAIVLGTMYWNPLLYVAIVIWIGARQHAISILMHDATHYRIVKNRRLNEFIGHALLAFPMFSPFRAYRNAHYAHHRQPNTEHDPDWMHRQDDDWQFPKTRAGMIWLLVRDATGLNSFDIAREARRYNKVNDEPRWISLCRVAGYLTMFAVLIYFRLFSTYLLFWVVPYLTAHKVIFRLRAVAEHFGIETGHPYTDTRTVMPAWWERVIIAPFYVNLHLAHHLYPSVPFYNLPKLQSLIDKSETYQSMAHVTPTYMGMLYECLRDYPQQTTV